VYITEFYELNTILLYFPLFHEEKSGVFFSDSVSLVARSTGICEHTDYWLGGSADEDILAF
jgi:hypothetical protein